MGFMNREANLQGKRPLLLTLDLFSPTINLSLQRWSQPWETWMQPLTGYFSSPSNHPLSSLWGSLIRSKTDTLRMPLLSPRACPKQSSGFPIIYSLSICLKSNWNMHMISTGFSFFPVFSRSGSVSTYVSAFRVSCGVIRIVNYHLFPYQAWLRRTYCVMLSIMLKSACDFPQIWLGFFLCRRNWGSWSFLTLVRCLLFQDLELWLGCSYSSDSFIMFVLVWQIILLLSLGWFFSPPHLKLCIFLLFGHFFFSV